MSSFFKGRVILSGAMDGQALVTHSGFNTYASFYSCMHTGTKRAICSHSGNLEIYGKNMTDKIICLPKTIGSTSGGAVWQRVSEMGIAPKAMLFSQRIDSLAAGGLIVADIWAGKRICTIDQLGHEFLECVKDGDTIRIDADGTVAVFRLEFSS